MMLYLRVLLLLAACSPSHYVRAAAVPQILDPEIDRVDDSGVIRNANHIFNAIHSSMRQWGSSLNHNGMSFFLTQVPAGTQFYHGTGQLEPVQGMEWLAFEPEHAIVFARKMKHPKGSPHGGPGQDDRLAPPPYFFDDDSGRNHEYAVHRFPPPEKAGRKPHPSLSSKGGCHNRPDRTLSPLGQEDRLDRQRPRTEDRPALHESSQNHLMPNDDKDKRPRRPPFEMDPGWLHTYKTKDTLPLLYIDGMSAGKSDKGTLDSQDTLLLNVTEDQDRHGFWEVERANRLCKLAKGTWDGKVKGFIRMEAGFEIILCSFAEDLDFVRAVKAGPFAPNRQDPDNNNNTEEPGPGRGGGGGGGGMRWIKAISARYDGIGGDRVKVDYDTFVTSYAYDLDLFKDHDSALPRLENLSVASLDEVRNDVDAMVRNWDPSKLKQDSTSPINWQSIADMVVERYAKELQYLVSGGGLNTPDAFFNELGVMLHVFIDSDQRNTTAEVERCVGQFIPAGGVKLAGSSLAGHAISSVAERICSSLFAAFDTKVPVSESVGNLQELMRYLDWTVWKKCGECPLDKVCFIPIWPFGSVEDREHPQCRSAPEFSGRGGYWGHPRP